MPWLPDLELDVSPWNKVRNHSGRFSDVSDSGTAVTRDVSPLEVCV